jgi:PKD repeat protein
VALNTDTIAKLVTSGGLPSTTVVLPIDKIVIPTAVQVGDGSNSSTFNFSIDLEFLKNNPNKNYAIGLTISSNDRPVTSGLSSIIILINTNILIPSANFTSTLNAATKTVSLVNSSLNWVNYTWDYGDGSPAVTTPLSTINDKNRVLTAITKTYAAAGTYTITLTAVGLPLVSGQVNQSVKTMTVVVP